MSIKLKLSALISSVVVLILALNLLVFYLYTSTQHTKAAEQQIQSVAEEIQLTLSPALRTNYYLETDLSERLRVASIAAVGLLGSDSSAISTTNLSSIASQLNLDSLSLVKQITGDEAGIVKSSNSALDGVHLYNGSIDADVIRGLMDRHYAATKHGTSLQNYWSDSVRDPNNESRIRLSYYYDGSTDYVLRVSYNTEGLLKRLSPLNKSQQIEKVIRDNPGLVEITGINVDKLFWADSNQPSELRSVPRDAIEFGQYQYKNDKSDYDGIESALHTGETVYLQTKENGKKLLKGYIPFSVDQVRNYVAVISIDRTLFAETLDKQLFLLFSVSITLLILTILASYWLAGVALRGLKLVVQRVNLVALGDFSQPIEIRSRDEIGELANSVNVMAASMNSYTNRLMESTEELRHTKEYLESLVHHTKDAIHVYDLEGHLISANRAFESMLGWKEEELQRYQICTLPHHRKQTERMIEHVLLGEPWIDRETWLETRDGQKIDVSTTASPIRDQNGVITAVSCITRNVTSRKHTEELLRRAEKLSVVGQLAAGVAHEIRNPLTTLRGFVQMQMNNKPLSPYYLSIMLSELDRINFIVSEFLVLSKPQADLFHRHQLSTMLEDMAALMESESHLSGVTMELDLQKGIPLAVCEPNQLKQVFVNIIKNGIESMTASGGRLTIALHLEKPDLAVVTIKDEGIGIPEEHFSRLGEPFFTSKESGNGLGLMVSQRIVSNHKGTFEIESRSGQGTTVRISLPVELEAG